MPSTRDHHKQQPAANDYYNRAPWEARFGRIGHAEFERGVVNIFRNPDYHMVDVQTAYRRPAPPPPFPPLYEYVEYIDKHFPTAAPNPRNKEANDLFKISAVRRKRDVQADTHDDKKAGEDMSPAETVAFLSNLASLMEDNVSQVHDLLRMMNSTMEVLRRAK
jgi:hypothetical protein